MTTDVAVTGLFTYPIKSCAGMSLDAATLTNTGFELDRQWALVDDEGRAVSQEQHPLLAKVVPEVGVDAVVLSVDGAPVCTFDIEPATGSTVDVSVFGHGARGEAYVGEINEWFSDYLGVRVRLARVSTSEPRLIKDVYRQEAASNQVGFANRFSLHLVTEQSLSALNTQLDVAVPVTRFRPSIVVAGVLDAYEEDTWDVVAFGDVVARVVRACGRCAVTDTDQLTADRGRSVRKALGRTRNSVDLNDPDTKRGLHFGQYLVHENAGTVRLGDAVTVFSRHEAANISFA